MESTIPSSLSASSSLTTRYTLNENEKGDAFSTSESVAAGSTAAITATNLKSFSRSRLEQLLKEHDIQRSQAAVAAATLHNNRPPAQVICISTPQNGVGASGTGSVQSSGGSGSGHGHGHSHIPSAFAPVSKAAATAALLSNLSLEPAIAQPPPQQPQASVVRKTLLPPGRRVDSDDDHGNLELGMTTTTTKAPSPRHVSTHTHPMPPPPRRRPPQDTEPMIPSHHAAITQHPNTIRHHNGTTTSGMTSRPHAASSTIQLTTKQPPPMVVTEVVVPLSMSQQKQQQQQPQPLPQPVPPTILSAQSAESISPLEKSPTIWEENAIVNDKSRNENDNASVHSDDAIHEPSPPPALEAKVPGAPQPLELPPAPPIPQPQPLPLLQQQHSKSYSRSSRRSLLSSCGSRRSLATSMGTYSNRSLLSRATSRGSTALELECLMMRSTCSSTWSSTGAGVGAGAGTLNHSTSQVTTTMPQASKVLPTAKQEQSAQATATTNSKRAKSTTPPGFIRNVTHASVRHLQRPDNPVVPNLDGRTKPNAVTTSDESTFINEEGEDASSTTPSDPRAQQRQRLEDDPGHVGGDRGTTGRASEHHSRRSHRSRHDKTHGETTANANDKHLNDGKRHHLGVVPFTTIRLVRPVAQPPQPARPSS